MNVIQLNKSISCDRVHSRNNYKEKVHIMQYGEIEIRKGLKQAQLVKVRSLKAVSYLKQTSLVI